MGTIDRGPLWSDPPDDAMYLIINTINYNKQAADLPIFGMRKWLDQWLPGTTEAKPRRDGSILALAKTRKIADTAINSANNFFDICQIKVEQMEAMNRCQGVIYSREILNEPVESLVEQLRNDHVVAIERVQSFKDKALSPNGLHIITFNKRTLPKNIVIGYIRCTVKQYIPRPLRCVRCCTYGHSRKNCQEENEFCKDCAEIRHENECNGPKKCRNCQGSHNSFDKNCPVLKREEAIVQLKVSQNISFGMARQMYMARIDSTKKSYAANALEWADKEAQSMVEELDEVRNKIKATEKIKETLAAEVEKLKSLAQDIVYLQRQKASLQKIVDNNGLTNTVQQQQPSTSGLSLVHTTEPINMTQSTQESTFESSILHSQTTHRFQKSTEVAIEASKSLPNSEDDLMDFQNETAKRKTRDNDSDSEKELDKKKKVFDDFSIGINEFAGLTKGQKKVIRNGLATLSNNETNPPLFWKKGYQINQKTNNNKHKPSVSSTGLKTIKQDHHHHEEHTKYKKRTTENLQTKRSETTPDTDTDSSTRPHAHSSPCWRGSQI